MSCHGMLMSNVKSKSSNIKCQMYFPGLPFIHERKKKANYSSYHMSKYRNLYHWHGSDLAGLTQM